MTGLSNCLGFTAVALKGSGFASIGPQLMLTGQQLLQPKSCQQQHLFRPARSAKRASQIVAARSWREGESWSTAEASSRAQEEGKAQRDIHSMIPRLCAPYFFHDSFTSKN